MLESEHMEEKINNIETDYLGKISQAKNLNQLDDIFLALFGKTGVITLFPKNFSVLPKDELKIIAPIFNKIKSGLETAIEERRSQIREEKYKNLINDKTDISESESIVLGKGHLHPITKIEREIVELFSKIGFQQFEAPHIDTDEYNFGLLNIPQTHPSRDLWDTLYISSEAKNPNSKLLLRTHTSNAQVRIIRQFKPPIRMMVIDRCFRYENLDARHEHTFEQFELVVIDKGLNMANLQYLSEYFLKFFLGSEIKARLRPKYFPFVEPGAGVDGLCLFCKGKGCRICGGVGWLELAGAGMIHPQVIKNGGLDPEVYSGIAWGFGPERMAMLKYGISDVRQFKNGDLKFLEGVDK
jgi:phenylalanyl-tRNA synthetase alpha chain